MPLPPKLLLTRVKKYLKNIHILWITTRVEASAIAWQKATTPFLPCMQQGSVWRDSPYYLFADIVVICHNQATSNHPPLCICGSVQTHWLLPPPLLQHHTSPPFALLTTSHHNWSGCNVCRDCLTTDLDICGNGFYAAFF